MIDGACSTHGKQEQGVHKVLVGKPEGKRLLGILDVDESIILNLILRKGWEGVHWIQLILDRVKRQAH